MYRKLLITLFFIMINAAAYSQVSNCLPESNHTLLTSNISEQDLDAILAPSGSFYSVGSSITVTNHISKARISLFDATGKMTWSQFYKTGAESLISATLFNNIIYTSDNHIVVGGTLAINATTSPAIIKLTADGVPVWTKVFSSVWSAVSIVTLSDGSIIFTLNHRYGDQKDVVGKLDKDGNFVWCKVINTSRVLAGTTPHELPQLLTDGKLLFLSINIPVMTTRSTANIMKLNPVNGAILWEKEIGGSDFSLNLTPLTIKNNQLYFGLHWTNYPTFWVAKKGRLTLDVDGNISRIVCFDLNSSTSNASYKFFRNDPFLASVYTQENRFGLMYVNDAGTVEWKYNYYPGVDYATIGTIVKASTGEWFVSTRYFVDPTGFSYYGWLHSKVLPNGSTPGCPTDAAIPLFPSTLSLTVGAAANQLVDTILPSLTSSLIRLQGDYPDIVLCKPKNNCTSLQLNGPTSVCGFTDTVRYIAKRNVGCTMPVQWAYDASFVSYAATTDSSLAVVFQKNGTFHLKSFFSTACPLEQSLSVAVTASVGAVALGADRTLCPNNQLILDAGLGYTKYEWQDHSTLPTFVVTQPGTYYIAATNSCGQVFKDTINVTAAPPIPFDLGPDLEKCENEKLTLTAPVGFSNYKWWPNEELSAITGSSVTTTATRTTKYFLSATKMADCILYDSIIVQVKLAPLLNLGTDLRLCQGDSATLDAGPGFVNYTWSNGLHTPQITVNTIGRYSVAALASNGCTAYDTLDVLQLYAIPVVQLDKDPLLCPNGRRLLNAGNGQSKYEWSTGVSTPTITVEVPGTYWVKITDNNQCKGADTVIITGWRTAPAAFLPSDTTLCNYGSLTIGTVRTYPYYLWSNGAHTAFTDIRQPGTYWLDVTDAFGCKGRDSILVQSKECLSGLYVPNAFTPNRDNKNDQFKPLVYGDVMNYEFRIYNRWGQVVFQTTDSKQGWDGYYKSIAQESQLFIWYCRYQLRGQPQQEGKGTVLLFR